MPTEKTIEAYWDEDLERALHSHHKGRHRWLLLKLQSGPLYKEEPNELLAFESLLSVRGMNHLNGVEDFSKLKNRRSRMPIHTTATTAKAKPFVFDPKKPKVKDSRSKAKTKGTKKQAK